VGSNDLLRGRSRSGYQVKTGPANSMIGPHCSSCTGVGAPNGTAASAMGLSDAFLIPRHRWLSSGSSAPSTARAADNASYSLRLSRSISRHVLQCAGSACRKPGQFALAAITRADAGAFYLRYAEECIALAAKSSNPAYKARLLQMARSTPKGES
jgi:hypothetical protein